MDTIKEALTFDDVLLLPKYSDILPSKTNITLQLSKEIFLVKCKKIFVLEGRTLEYFGNSKTSSKVNASLIVSI